MPDLLNIDEVFAIAVQIEANGAAFYRKAAAQHEDAKQREGLLNLAAMEDEHERIFAQMREDLRTAGSATSDVDPRLEGGLFLSSIANGYRLEGSPAVAERLTGDESLEQILEIGLDLEKQAILFYLGVKDIVSDEVGRAKVDKIIDEEKKHVVFFTDELKKVRA